MCYYGCRVGSLFQFQYSVGTLGPGNSSQLLVNNSITFHTSNATIFLIGGKPDNALVRAKGLIQHMEQFVPK